MVEEQGSHQTTRALTVRQKVEIEIDRRVDLKLAEIQARIDRLFAQNKTLEVENTVLREEVTDLRVKYNEIRRLVHTLESVNAANSYNERIVEQIDIQAEIIGAFVDLFVPLYEWLHRIVQKRLKLKPTLHPEKSRRK